MGRKISRLEADHNYALWQAEHIITDFREHLIIEGHKGRDACNTYRYQAIQLIFALKLKRKERDDFLMQLHNLMRLLVLHRANLKPIRPNFIREPENLVTPRDVAEHRKRLMLR